MLTCGMRRSASLPVCSSALAAPQAAVMGHVGQAAAAMHMLGASAGSNGRRPGTYAYRPSKGGERGRQQGKCKAEACAGGLPALAPAGSYFAADMQGLLPMPVASAGPLVCQVEGCGVALDNLREYHQRYRVRPMRCACCSCLCRASLQRASQSAQLLSLQLNSSLLPCFVSRCVRST